MKHLISDEDEGVTVRLCKNHDLTSKLMWKDMFGDVGLKDVRVSDIKLPRHPIVQVDARKIKSLSLKYHAIPEQYRYYYPQVEECDNIDEPLPEPPMPASSAAPKRKSVKVTATPGVPKKGKVSKPKQPVGRPRKNRMVLLAGQQTIHSMFQRQVVASCC